MLSKQEIHSFEQDGFIALRNVFSKEIAEQCMDVIWDKLAEQGVNRNDKSTWKKPVVRVYCSTEAPLVKAGRSAVLMEAYNQLLGDIDWDSGEAVSGSFPVRFPSEENPGDTGWHIDGSFTGADGFWVNIHSKGRGLLVLFLFTDVDENDAPTRILRGSHLDVVKVVNEFGTGGCNFQKVVPNLNQKTLEREVVKVIGQAGDVFICHPFLVHAATWPHRGNSARAIAQAGVEIKGFELVNNGSEGPVERSILRGIANET